MSEHERSVQSEVEVAVDPRTAFQAFTDEIDLWWVRSPIAFYDSARAIAIRCEPGVGGRLLEVYGDDPEDARVLGVIRVWEPGARLAWDGGGDDVRIDVTFEATRSGGTRVRVLATIPAGGRDAGGTFWVRVVPSWFPAWCTRRESAPRQSLDLARLAVTVRYRKPAEAGRWLADAFGFEPISRFPDSESAHWVELHVGNSAIVLRPLEGDGAPGEPAHLPWVFVDDLDAHFAHASARGARIVEPIHQRGYRAYVADDPEGRRWMIAQARPTMR